MKKKKPTLKKYSVLLLYPEHVSDGYGETFYAFVSAANPQGAALKGQTLAAKHNLMLYDASEFTVVLVTEGHNWGHQWWE